MNLGFEKKIYSTLKNIILCLTYSNREDHYCLIMWGMARRMNKLNKKGRRQVDPKKQEFWSKVYAIIGWNCFPIGLYFIFKEKFSEDTGFETAKRMQQPGCTTYSYVITGFTLTKSEVFNSDDLVKEKVELSETASN